MYPLSSGIDDLFFNLVKDPKLRNLGCQKVLVFVIEKDVLYDSGDALYDRGMNYSMALRMSVLNIVDYATSSLKCNVAESSKIS